jgi:alginate biosynthesis protein AlgX
MRSVHRIPRVGIPALALITTYFVASEMPRAQAAAEYPSAFQCKNLEKAAEIQLLEGKDGMFFRIIPDIKMYHPFTDATIDDLARISSALKAKGTTLIYVPVPTKSMILPGQLPERAKLYGFDPVIANSIYDDVIKRLGEKGVVAVDIASAMRTHSKSSNGDFAFFRTDFHWTAQGAGPAAKEIARRIVLLPGYSGEPKLNDEPVELPSEKISSTMHKIVQHYCRLAVPDSAAHPYKFPTADTDIFGEKSDAAAETNIFADGGSAAVALVGTSFSDMGVSNFAGFLQHYSGLPVENYSISGGNQFGSILSYLTSREFKESRPKFLVWENPIYNNLAQFGDAPLKEILASANEDCGQALPTEKLDGRTLTVNLSGKKLDSGETFLADIGDNRGRKAVFRFIYSNGEAREREVERGDRLRSTGRYFLPLDDLSGEVFSKVAITFDADITESTSVSVCKSQQGDKSL